VNLSQSLLELALGAAALAAIFVPLERCFTARRQPHLREGWRTDAAFFVAQYLAFAGLFSAFNRALIEGVGALGPAPLTVAVAALPLAGQAVLVVVAGDLGLYWGHRLAHRIPILWRFHAVHHSATRLDWLAAHREHPLDGLYSQFFLTVPAAVLGVEPGLIMPLLVSRGLWAVLIHSNVRLPVGPLGLLLGDPILHRWHHARVERCVHNFANLAPYLDWIFGTHHRPANERYELGISEHTPAGFVGYLAGVRASVREEGCGEGEAGGVPTATCTSEDQAVPSR